MKTIENLEKRKYVKVEEGKKITFNIQDGPIREVGSNGCQIETLGMVWLEILKGLNKNYPCRENSLTITKIEEALMWQEARTKDKTNRKVEGYNKE